MPTVPDIHRRGTRAEQGSALALTVGTLYFVTDEGLTERWTGAAWEGYSGLGTGSGPPPPPPGATQTTFLISGGQVVWQAAYTFRVTAADYYINGTRCSSAEATVTLAAAHATLDRLDVIALDTLGAVVVLAGVASATPSEPSVNPALFLKLAIVFVAHATVEPPTLQTRLAYAEATGAPTEWAWTASGPSIVINSSAQPHAGTLSIDGTNVPAGVYAQGTAAAAFDPTGYDHLLLFVRVKSAWNNSRGLLLTLRRAGAIIGATVELRRSGTYGFDGTQTTGYQLVAIPITAFSVPQGALIDQVRLEDFGGAIGFYVDDISFQTGGATGGGSSGLTQDQADAQYAPLVHAARHASGAPDALAVTALGGYPGGSTTFLRADGTFATPASGTPGAHHATHETGGADAIAALSGSVITTGTIAAARLPPRIGALGIVIDGGASVITTGIKGFLEVPFACTITGVTLLSTDPAVLSGSIVVDIWKAPYASYPPTVANTITASAKPTLSGATKSKDITLPGWTQTVNAGDVLGFKVDSAAIVTRVALSLTVQA